MTGDFEAFMAEVQPTMHNLALGLTGGDVHEAQDLVQTSLERMWSRWERLQVDAPRAYARAVLVREFVSVRRRLRWRLESTRGEVPDAAVADFASATDASVVLLRALSNLPRRQRQVVVLRYLEDLAIAEVASLLSCTEGTVKRSAHDGLRALRSSLEGTLDGSERDNA